MTGGRGAAGPGTRGTERAAPWQGKDPARPGRAGTTMRPYRLIVLRHGQSEWNAAGIFTGWGNAHLTARARRKPSAPGRCWPSMACCPPSRTPRCSGALSAPPTSSWRPRTATGSRCAGLGGSTGGTTGRCKAGTRPRCSRSTASSSSRPGAGRTTPRRRRSAWRLRPFRPVIPVTGALRPRSGPTPSPSGTSPHGCCPTGTTRSCRTCWPADARSSSPTATRCGRWSSTWTTIPDDQIAELDIPTGIPLVYQLGPDLRPDTLGGQYLDPHAARDAIEAIRNQGRVLARPSPGGSNEQQTGR